MKIAGALIFGFNEYGIEIARNVQHKYKNIILFNLDKSEFMSTDDVDFIIEMFDLSDDWDNIEDEYDIEKSIIFCAIRDEAKNIFLTISLRSHFKDATIISLANNQEDANKLKMAGASKVIPIVETTADIITDMLKKPIATEILHHILYENSELKIAQIKITNTKHFYDKFPADINWSRKYGILVLSVVHEDMSREFIYSSKSKHTLIKEGDILVVVGYDTDIKEFEKKIGS
jgi:Trk K+ transport system NAD-binding subunit